MHSCCDAVLVYGFEEPSWCLSLEEQWLEAQGGGGLGLWASAIIRGHICSSICGVRASMSTDGMASVATADRAIADSFYERYVEYHLARPPADNAALAGAEWSRPVLGFHLAVQADYESEHVHYTLDEVVERYY